MEMISISEAKKHLNKLISSGEHITITINGKPNGVLVPYDLYVTLIRLKREIEDNESIKRAVEYFKKKENKP